MDFLINLINMIKLVIREWNSISMEEKQKVLEPTWNLDSSTYPQRKKHHNFQFQNAIEGFYHIIWNDYLQDQETMKVKYRQLRLESKMEHLRCQEHLEMFHFLNMLHIIKSWLKKDYFEYYWPSINFTIIDIIYNVYCFKII